MESNDLCYAWPSKSSNQNICNTITHFFQKHFSICKIYCPLSTIPIVLTLHYFSFLYSQHGHFCLSFRETNVLHISYFLTTNLWKLLQLSLCVRNKFAVISRWTPAYRCIVLWLYLHLGHPQIGLLCLRIYAESEKHSVKYC